LIQLLSSAYGAVVALRRAWYTRQPSRQQRLTRPVVSVGNLRVGGSGKTPIVEYIARLLVERGERPAILTRGYGRSGEGGVVSSLDAERYGDEPVLIKKSLDNVIVVVGSKRYQNGAHINCDVYLLDDGFQHLQLHRDLDVVIDAPRARWHREGRSALFKIDLTDQHDPEPVYWHEQRDVAGLLVDSRAKLLGVMFESNVLGPQYIDPRAAAINAALQKSNPNRWYWINDVSEDGKVFLIGTSSVSESGASYILDASGGSVRFEALGAEWPGLARHSLPPTRAVGIRTRTGAMKELLFTAPAPGGRKAPLVVFADGTQSTGGFEPATYFLASRGYAVLRPYFSGREAEAYWQNRPYLDWNGGLYDELIDAVSWATQRDDVDATRICIVGRNAYGGYQALLAAARPEGPFKCAASLEGLSDLEKPRKEVARASLIEDERPTGTSDAQVALESPLRRAAEFRLPMLLVEDDTRTHSARDHEGGREMAAALAAAKKPHKLVLIDETEESYLRREYAELEKFLADNLR